jgi:hypothetical protein
MQRTSPVKPDTQAQVAKCKSFNHSSNMKVIRWFWVVLCVAALAAAIAGWNKARNLAAEVEGLRAETSTLKEQIASSAAVQTAAQNQEMESLRDQAQDALKLRNEVNQLRAVAKEVEKLRADNAQLRGLAQQRAANPAPAPAPAVNPPKSGDQFPRDSWTFAGYATPESALISAIWAMREGKPQTYLESLSPDEQERMAKTWLNKPETEIAAKHQQDVAAITGVRVMDRQNVNDTEVVMNVWLEGVNKPEKISMKRVGNDWKFGGFIRSPAGQPAPTPVQ